MNEKDNITYDKVVVLDPSEYFMADKGSFSNAPEIVKPFLKSAELTLSKIKEMLYVSPSFINLIKASVPETTFQAILTDDQKSKIANGMVEILTKKDGTLMAVLRDSKTKKITENINLEKIKVSPDITQAMATYATQMQMAQIAEEMQMIQLAVEEVRQGQEFDRLATAYSCQQKLLQALSINNPDLKATALLRIALDAEDSRNLLMQTQNSNLLFIKNQPESFWGKFISGAKPEKINSRISEIRESLCAVNMVSLAEAIAYNELGETDAARISLQFYAKYIQNAYLETEGLVERLDLIDPSPINYWSKTLPEIEAKIQALPFERYINQKGEKKDGEKM